MTSPRRPDLTRISSDDSHKGVSSVPENGSFRPLSNSDYDIQKKQTFPRMAVGHQRNMLNKAVLEIDDDSNEMDNSSMESPSSPILKTVSNDSPEVNTNRSASFSGKPPRSTRKLDPKIGDRVEVWISSKLEYTPGTVAAVVNRNQRIYKIVFDYMKTTDVSFKNEKWRYMGTKKIG